MLHVPSSSSSSSSRACQRRIRFYKWWPPQWSVLLTSMYGSRVKVGWTARCLSQVNGCSCTSVLDDQISSSSPLAEIGGPKMLAHKARWCSWEESALHTWPKKRRCLVCTASDNSGCRVLRRTSNLGICSDEWIHRMRFRHQLSRAPIIFWSTLFNMKVETRKLYNTYINHFCIGCHGPSLRVLIGLRKLAICRYCRGAV